MFFGLEISMVRQVCYLGFTYLKWIHWNEDTKRRKYLGKVNEQLRLLCSCGMSAPYGMQTKIVQFIITFVSVIYGPNGSQSTSWVVWGSQNYLCECMWYNALQAILGLLRWNSDAMSAFRMKSNAIWHSFRPNIGNKSIKEIRTVQMPLKGISRATIDEMLHRTLTAEGVIRN